jgi:hypothetical protein
MDEAAPGCRARKNKRVARCKPRSRQRSPARAAEAGQRMTEADLQREVLLLYGAHPRVRLWRANAGRALVATSDGALRPVRMNVDGCPDAIGWTSVPVARLVELAIPTVAIFTGLEFKSLKGRVRPAQVAFADTLRRMGGLSVMARSVADVDRALGPYL